jgi:hypothetical protein
MEERGIAGFASAEGSRPSGSARLFGAGIRAVRFLKSEVLLVLIWDRMPEQECSPSRLRLIYQRKRRTGS